MVRYLKEQDINRIVYLEESVLGETIGKDLLLDSLCNDNEYVYVYEEKGIIVGYMSTYIVAGTSEILNFCVDTSYQHKGIGSKIFSAYINDCVKNKVSDITLEVRKSNQKGINFYLKYGFKNVAIRKEYYANKEDAYLMKKEITL